MFYLRLNKVNIKDNGRNPIIKKKDKASLILASIVTSEYDYVNEIGKFQEAKTAEARKKILNNVAAKVLKSIEFPTIENIVDNHDVVFGNTGHVVYKADKIPNEFNWCVFAIGSRRTQRERAERARKVLESKAFKTVTDTLGTLAPTGAAAATAAILKIGSFVAQQIAKAYENKKDDQLGLFMASFVRAIDYPHGQLVNQRVPDTTMNMHIDYMLFGIDE